jgi:hypothetical protein
MDVTNLTQFENIIIDCSRPPTTADRTIAADAFVQPVVLTFEGAIRFVGFSSAAGPREGPATRPGGTPGGGRR